jgi:hypothetical protein
MGLTVDVPSDLVQGDMDEGNGADLWGGDRDGGRGLFERDVRRLPSA